MKKIHNHLLEHSKWYSDWHNYSRCSVVHWAVFVVVTMLLMTGTLLSIQKFVVLTESESNIASVIVPSYKGGKVGEAEDHILVKFKKTLTTKEQEKILSRNNLKEKSEIKAIGVKLISISADDTPQEAVDKLKAKEKGNLEFVEVDAILAPDLIPNDSYWPSQWDKSKINTPLAWDSNTGSNTVIVGVADTGVDCTHEDLTANCVSGWNFYDNNSNAADVYGHGTAVAGIIGAAGNNARGVAGTVWNSKIMPLRVSGTSGSATYSAIAQAIIYAADHGVKVVNNSYQSGGSATVRSAAHYLKSKGGLLIVSEGNYGTLTSYDNSPDLISVSATDPNDALYSWSSYGNDVDVSAPGCGYATANGGSYRSFCGTSNSAPEVAGALALIFSVNSSLTADQAQTILFNSAKDLGIAGWDIYFGWGRIDVGAAVALAKGGTSNDTTSPSAPTNLSASAPDETKVNLAWTASIDNTGVVGYQVFRDSNQIAIVSSTNYTDTNVTSGASYSYTVKAYDAVGNVSPSSNTATVTVPTVSAKVSILNYSVTKKTATTATITWTTNIPSTGFVSYSSSSINLNLSATDGIIGTTHSVTITNLTKFRIYYYKITVTSGDGSSTASSPVSNFRTNKK